MPLLGKRCRWPVCPGCLPSRIGDHGRSFRRRNAGVRLFVGQPYDALGAAEQALLDRVRAMGLYVHVGAYGEGWYNSGTFPIVMSNEPIPEHGYRCAPESDDLRTRHRREQERV
jgi:hypothetical protein